MRSLTPDNVILGLLAAQPQHGYELVAHFRSPGGLGRVWTMSTSQVYAVLKRLERRGYASGREEAVADAPTRTVFAITPAGRAELDGWLFDARPSPSIRRIRVEFVSKLHVARLLDVPPDEIIDAQRAACQRQLDRLVAEREQFASDTPRLALDFVAGQLEAAIAWLDGCRERLRASTPHPS